MVSSRVRFPIGISDFRDVRERGFHFVDKSLFIEEVLDLSPAVLLIPRPRRFGKTLNLSMLRYFLEKTTEDRQHLFDGLAIASSEIARPHFQRYPVIFLTLKDVKPVSWESCLASMAGVMAEVYNKHRETLSKPGLSPSDAENFEAILHRRASQPQLATSLRLLSRLLAERHGEKVVLLIDEYDAPVQSGYMNHYYDNVVAFFRDFLSGGLKDNEHLFKGVLTGILRVSRESLFSGLNNIIVYSILRQRLATSFGFTEAEVQGLAVAAGQPESIDGMRSYYNGYLFGGQSIYNPWSVLCYLDSGEAELRPYWMATSSNDLVRQLLLAGPSGILTNFETLLRGGTIERRVDENIVLRDIDTDPDAVWSLLLFSGYLKPVSVSYEEGVDRIVLSVPNVEVGLALRNMAQAWLSRQTGGSDQLAKLLDSILRGDAPEIERHLAHIVKVNLSTFDTASPEPERFYHGLVVGLLAGLHPKYEVRSNRESGYGRCDVLIVPKTAGQPGVVLELKRVDTESGETTQRAITSALKQIRARQYATELRERGAAPIHELAAVFEGKQVTVRSSAASPAKKRKPSPAKKRPSRAAAAPAGKRTPKAASSRRPRTTKR